MFSHQLWFCSYLKSGFLISGSDLTFWFWYDPYAGSRLCCVFIGWCESGCVASGTPPVWWGSAGTWLEMLDWREVCNGDNKSTDWVWLCPAYLPKATTPAARLDKWNPLSAGRGTTLRFLFFSRIFWERLRKNKFWFQAFGRARAHGLVSASETLATYPWKTLTHGLVCHVLHQRISRMSYHGAAWKKNNI